MNWSSSNWVFLLLFGLYSLVLVWHALIGKRETGSTTDYYVGGRNMGGLALGMSFCATFCSTNGFVGMAGQSYSYGVPWLLYGWLLVGCCFISWRWIAPRFRELTGSFDSVTLADFVGTRYASPAARVIVAVILVAASVLYMTAIYKGMGNILEVFIDVPYSISIVIVFLITVAYTAIGGFKSVVRTDIVQGSMLLIAASLMFYGTTKASGGVGALMQLAERPPSAHLFTWDAGVPFAVLLGVMLAGSIKLLVEPRQLSRFYALRDDSAIRRGKLTSVAVIAVLYSLLLPIGLYARLLDVGPIEDTDLIIPLLLKSAAFLPWVGAFITLAIVAAAMSSLDSVLLVVAAVVQRDLAGQLFPASQKHAIGATRAYVVAIALIAALVALNPPGGIIEITTLSGSVYAACLTPVVIFGLHWHRGNGTSVITACLAGLLTLGLWKYTPYAGVLHEIFPAITASNIVYVTHASMVPSIRDTIIQRHFPITGHT